MGIRITWQDTNANEQGHRVYRSATPMDPENLPVPLVELGPNVEEYDDGSVIDGETWYYRVSTFSGGAESVGAEIVKTAEAGGGGSEDDFANAQIGDEIGGGIYAGVNTESDGTQYHIVFALQEGELAPGDNSRWKIERSGTSGTRNSTDGWANTAAMEAAGLADHPAAFYCRNYTGGGYTDWYLPALTEIALEANLRGHAELSLDPSIFRWSSREYSSGYAWVRNFNGSESHGNNSPSLAKDSTVRRVRPVRRVPVNP